MFQPTEPIKILKKERSQSVTNGANKNAKEPELCINYQTDNKNGVGSWDYFSKNAHRAYRGCYSSPAQVIKSLNLLLQG